MVNEQLSFWTRRIAECVIIVMALMGTSMGEVTRAGLAAEWHFDGDAKDSSGNGNNGVINGPTFVDGKFGKAWNFDGVNDYVEIKDDISLYPFKGLTIAAWVKPASDTSRWGNVRIIERASHNPTLQIRNGQYAAGINADGVWHTCYITGGSATANEWKYVAGTWDGQAMRIYVNGVLEGIDDSGCNQIQKTYDVTHIGGPGTNVGYDFSGIIDEVRIYNRALSAAEITAIFEIGQIIITSSPSGATIYLDNSNTGQTTPFTLTDVSPGSHAVSVSLSGYTSSPSSQTVTVPSGSTGNAIFNLTQIQQKSSISVSSTPSGATIYLDNSNTGQTTQSTLLNIQPGIHTVKCKLSGYSDYETNTTVTVGANATVNCPLSPLEAPSVEVFSEPSTIVPGEKSVITVKVTGKDNLSISGANVMLSTTPGSIGKIRNAFGRTDNEGVFITSFDAAAEGTITLNTKVRQENFPEGKRDIQIEVKNKKISASISGKIIDNKTGEPVSNTTVAFGNMSVTTGYDGKYELMVRIGEYNNLTITRPDYETMTKSITVPEEGNVINFSMAPIPPKSTISWSWIILILPIIGIITFLFYSKYMKKRQIEKKLPGSIEKPAPEIKLVPVEPSPIKSGVKLDVKSAYEYNCAKIFYKVKLENNTSETVGDIKVYLIVPDVFLLKEKEKFISMLEPKESKTVTFEIRPTGECGDCNISGKIEYYDYNTKGRRLLDIGTKMVSVICPVLKRKEIDIQQWEQVTDTLIKAEENIKELSVPAENLFNITSRVIKDNSMFMLKPEIASTPKLFEGFARFYAEGKTGLRYAAYIEVVGGSNKSRLILKVWAEKEEALTGFYHRLLDGIEKRIDVKIFIDDMSQFVKIVQNIGGDNIGGDRIVGDKIDGEKIKGNRIGTQITDSFVKDSIIGAGAGKCPKCGKEIEANEKICMECEEKL